MKKILLTGAAGFIGARCVEMLLDEGVHVVAIDNVNDYYDLRLKLYRLYRLATKSFAGEDVVKALDYRTGVDKYAGPDHFEGKNLNFNKVDIEDRAALEKLFSAHSFDAVINLAARAGVRYSMDNPFVYMTTNALGTLNLLECMKANSVKKMVLASTSSLYAGQLMPFKEDIPANTPLSPYAASKKAAELISYSYKHLYGLDISVVRYFTVFGPCGRPDMSIFRFIKWIDEGVPLELFGDGSQSRDFTYVDDIARGTILALKNIGYEIINLGGGNNPISMNDVISYIENALDKKAIIESKPFHIADIKETWADITKAGDLLKWSPEVSPYDGLQRTVQWHLENRDWLSSIKL